MDITTVMKERVVSVSVDATLEEAIELFVESGVGLLPVVDDAQHLVGVLGLQKVLELAWPAFIGMVSDFDFVHDFGEIENIHISEEIRLQPVSELMEQPVKVDADCKLLRAAALMRQHDLRDLPIVDDDNRLVGLASWVDVGTSFLRNWAGRESSSD